MGTIRASRTIAAPVDRVWAVFTDIPAAANNLPAITGIEVLTHEPFGPGYRWRETRRMFGQSATEEMQVSVSEEPDYYEVTADSRGTAYLTRYDFVPAPGGTRVDFTFSGTPHSTLTKVLTTLTFPLMKRMATKQLAQDLADLAAVCERG